MASHAYDLEGRLLSLGITNGTSLVTAYTYQWDVGGNILAITNNNGTQTLVSRYGYDAAGQLTNEVCSTNGFAGGATNSWQYDEAGNWLNANASSRWVYDRDNELTGRMPTAAATNKTITVTGLVDGGPNNNKWYASTAECRGVSTLVSPVNGIFALANVPIYPGTNNLEVTVTDVSGNSYQTSRLVVRTNTLETFQYDGNGNLTNWVNGSVTWNYEWDWADRMTKATSNGVVVLENWYDHESRRIAKKEKTGASTNLCLYTRSIKELFAVLKPDGATSESYLRGEEIAGDIGSLISVTHHTGSITNGTFYIQNNHRGDVVLTRSDNSTVASYVYSAFGNSQSTIGNDVCRFKFSSKERDASTGFYNFGYRFYAPSWQRWSCPDPMGDTSGNLFCFVHNGSISQVDPFGLFKVCIRPLQALPFTTTIVHCYIDAGDDGTFSYDPNGIHTDPNPNSSKKTCVEPKCCKNGSKSDLLDKITSDKKGGKWDGSDYKFFRHNCCHWVDSVLKGLGCNGVEDNFPGYNLPTHPASY